MSVVEVFSPAARGIGGREDMYPGFAPLAPLPVQVAPGDVMRVDFYDGDLLSVNAEDNAAAFFAVVDSRGRHSPKLLGTADASFSSSVVVDADCRDIIAELHQHGKTQPLQWAKLSPENDEPVIWKAKGDGALIIAAECKDNNAVFGANNGAVWITHQDGGKRRFVLPPPPGEVKEEIHIPRGTAVAYEVSPGDLIQIIDAEGRQCSDFMALNADELAAGRECRLDSTVTRTMVGGAYPAPGLFDKFYDGGMRPMLEVVQDTVGRHDTFALACTARGYENRGFFGHANCSDNISDVFSPYGIKRRDAWPAINFFFNSQILPDDNRLTSGEAWSRPGDYVLMRALGAMVCATTACPDDIDPINGWNPSDIFVRLCKPNARLRPAIAYRAFPNAPAVMTKYTPFYNRAAKSAQKFAAAKDYWMPVCYEDTGAGDEHRALREGAVMQDVSPLRKIDVRGPDAAKLLQKALTRNAQKLGDNRSLYTLLCDERGAVLDDGIVAKFGPDLFRLCCGSDETAAHLRDIAAAEKMAVWIVDMSGALGNLSVQGPKSRELLAGLIFTEKRQPRFDNLRWFGFGFARLKDRDGIPLVVSRTGYSGELGYELFCDKKDAETLWDAVRKAGAVPMGSAAAEIARVESGLMSVNEFGGGMLPAESGLDFAVDMQKESFIGKDAIARQSANKKITGLQINAMETPKRGDGVFVGRRKVGEITSAVLSPSLGKPLALARISTEVKEGEEVEVGMLDGHSKRLPATTSPLPFTDPTRLRPRT